jgi:twitching motility two-component system response regulator PilH
MARILVVDDSATQMQSIVKTLQKHGHEAITADDGEGAIEKARSDLPDLILMDVVMPGLNGFQATRHITKNESTRHIPVIMLTSKDQETDRLWAERQGARDYIIKPWQEDELIGKIQALLSS